MRRLLAMSFLSSFLLLFGFLDPAQPSDPRPEENDDTASLRRTMVKTQVEARGIKDPRVLTVLTKVKRHLFLPESMKSFAYQDSALPIGKNQTISQPYIVGLMTELARIEPQDKVLEIGTGSGYQTACCAELSRAVYSMEIIKELSDQARELLLKCGYKNIHVKHGDGYSGWPEAAPFDAIITTAAAPEIPQYLVEQLAVGGRMVVPVGSRDVQTLYKLTRPVENQQEIIKEDLGGCRFVSLIGESGWKK